MFTSGSIVGRSVWIEFANQQLRSKFEKMGLLHPTHFTKIAGIDERGLWCENPEYFLEETPTDKGIIKDYSPLVFFIPWHFVVTVLIPPREKDLRGIDVLGFRRTKTKRK
ncbi:MAG: hypothetical protein WBF13_04445 [Candidatus Zixiibacteriota bacterium]